MAVEIPRLQRLNDGQPQSAGRLEIQAPNLLGATAPLREGVGSAINQGVEVFEARQKEIRKQELAAKDLKATEAAVKYETQLKNDLTRIEQLSGDVTPAYKKFDEDMATLEDDIYTQVGEDQETRLLLREKIIKANGRVSDSRTTQQTKQYYKWQKEVGDSSVKLRQDNAMKASEALDSRNPLTLGAVQNQLNEIEQTRVSIAKQNGYDIPIKVDENGRTTIDYSNAPSIETQIKQDIGDAVIPMVKALNAAGKTKEAKQLIESQDRWLNADDKAKLTADNDEASVKNQALAKLATKSSWSIDEIKSLKDVDNDVKFKMQELNHTESLHREREQKQKADATMDREFRRLSAKQASNGAYVSAAEYINTPEYKNIKDKLSTSQLRTLHKIVEAPIDSDPEALADMWEAYRNGDLGDWDSDTFLSTFGRLNSKNRGDLMRMRNNQGAPTTDARRQTIATTAIAKFEDAANVYKNQFGEELFPRKNVRGKMVYVDPDDELRMHNAKNNIEKIITQDPNIKYDTDKLQGVIQTELDKVSAEKEKTGGEGLRGLIRGIQRNVRGIRENLTNRAASQAISVTQSNPPPTPPQGAPKKSGAPVTPTAPAKPSGTPKVDKVSKTDMTTWTMSNWKAEFFKVNGRNPKDGTELLNWKKQRLAQ